MKCLVVRHGRSSLRSPLPASRATLGSSATSDLRLRFPGVSRHHATILPTAEGLLLVDAGSKNGLIFAGQRVPEVLLLPGRAVQLGQAFLALEEVDSSEAELAFPLPDAEARAGEPRTYRETIEVPPAGDAASPAAGLRLLCEIEGPGGGAPGEGDLFSRARAALGAETLLVCDHGADSLLRLSLCAGGLPDPTVVGFLETKELGGALVLPQRIGDSWVVASPASPGAERLAAIFAAEPPSFACDLLGLLARRWLAASSGSPHLPARGGALPELDFPPEMLLGTSAAMRELCATMRATVGSGLDFLILGETGTGKELIARTLHRSGPLARGPFVALNCAAIPSELLEAELFGVTRGAATGVEARPGRFAEAHGGTILLDEIGELPAALQAKLLRVLQEREVLPLGGRVPQQLRLRVVSASNRDLVRRVEEGSFRADLYFRLRGVELRVPPLRERRSDLAELTLAFAARAAARAGKVVRGVSRKAFALLAAHDWPGNVRELEIAVERAVLLCAEGGTLESSHFYLSPLRPLASAPPGRPSGGDGDTTPAPDSSPRFAPLAERVERVEREAIREALVLAQGNKTRAARLLGITRNGLSLKLGRLGLDGG